MRPTLIPSEVSPLLPFQTCTQNVLERTDVAGINGSTSTDGYFSWLYHGPHLEVITTKSQRRVAAWQFGSIVHDTGTEITCVKEYFVDGSMKLLVGLTNSINQGMVCLFDIFKSVVLKAIEFPQKVSSLISILNVEGDQVPSWAIGNNLREFHGIIAVGVQCGYVYLIDMCLDCHTISNEIYPSSLQLITPRSRDAEHTRQQALSKGNVIAMLLNEESCSRGIFTFHRPNDTVVKTYKTESVAVTCLEYIQQAGLLCVGFSFGGFQLWKLYNPMMEYNSRLEAEPNAISHFTYQEPENDPKNFCYLWVARDHSVVSPGQENVSTVCLYQLCYGKKTLYNNYGVFYEELESVCLRLEHELVVDPFNPASRRNTWMSHIVSCYTVVDSFYKPPMILPENDSFEEGCHGPDLALSVIVWEAQDSGPGDKSNYFLAVFDINRWYHAQMPASVRFGGVSCEVCPYFAVYRLNDITDVALPDVLLHLHVRRNSIKRFINNAPLPPDQHFFPSSLSFDGVCLLETGLMFASFLGLQRQVLYEMRNQGPHCLLAPLDMYNACILVGLLPKQDILSLASNVSFQRKALLTMTLEYPMISFIVDCIRAWADGEFVHQGCTLKFLLDWTWEQVSNTKRIIDENCRCLYDWSGKHVDRRMLHTLHKANRTFRNLLTVLESLIQSAPSTEQGLMELESKQSVLTLLREQLQVILWFIDAKLLPEDDDAVSETSPLFCYPFCKLDQVYNSHRKTVQQLHSGMKGTELLLIDGLINNCGAELGSIWKRQGGSGLYPPPSLHTLLGIYLLPDVSLDKKNAITLYMLFDLISLLPEDKEQEFSEKIAEFANMFNIRHLVPQISGFWLLDHQDFNDALKRFFDPSSGKVIGSWQHTRIIKTFLYHREHKMALRYLIGKNVPITTPEHVKLKLTVLVANGLTTEALDFQRRYRNQMNMSDLLSHFFLGCQQMKSLDQLLRLPLDEIEEKHLIVFLSESTELQEILVMYYLQRARYIEAIRLNEHLRQSALSEKNQMVRERAATRNLIVDAYARILPECQIRLIKENPELSTSAEKRICVKRPRPLSTVVRKSEKTNIQSFSRLILGYMKDHEIHRTTEDTDERLDTEKDLGPFLRTPITPRKKSRLSYVPDVVYPKPTLNDSYEVEESSSPAEIRDIPRRKFKLRTADSMMMLNTPEVRRKSRGKSLLPEVQRIPQSILKVRRFVTKSPSPATSSHDLMSSRNVKKSIAVDTADIGEMSVLRSPNTVASSTTPTRVKALQKDETSKLDSPKSLRFADTVSTSSGHLFPGTPKLLRFTEPESDESSPPVTPPLLSPSLTPPSPSSPRLLRDRSPTPVSMSPKLIPRCDNLVRRPLQSFKESLQWVDADSEGEITFNLTKTINTEEVMEVEDDDATDETVTMEETPATFATQKVETRSSDAVVSEVTEEFEPGDVPTVSSEIPGVCTASSTSDHNLSTMSVPPIDLTDIGILNVQDFLLTPAAKVQHIEKKVRVKDDSSRKVNLGKGSEKRETENVCVQQDSDDKSISEVNTQTEKHSDVAFVSESCETTSMNREWKLQMVSSDEEDVEGAIGVKLQEIVEQSESLIQSENIDQLGDKQVDKYLDEVVDDLGDDPQLHEHVDLVMDVEGQADKAETIEKLVPSISVPMAEEPEVAENESRVPVLENFHTVSDTEEKSSVHSENTIEKDIHTVDHTEEKSSVHSENTIEKDIHTVDHTEEKSSVHSENTIEKDIHTVDHTEEKSSVHSENMIEKDIHTVDHTEEKSSVDSENMIEKDIYTVDHTEEKSSVDSENTQHSNSAVKIASKLDSQSPQLSESSDDVNTQNKETEKLSHLEDVPTTVPSTPPRQSKPSPSRARRRSARKSSVSEDADNYMDSPARSTRSARKSMLSAEITQSVGKADGDVSDQAEPSTPKSKTRLSRGAGKSATRKLMQMSPGRVSRSSISEEDDSPVQMTKLKIPLPVVSEEFEITPISPIRRSPRVMMNSLTKQLHDHHPDPLLADIPERVVTRTRSGRSITPTTPVRKSSRRKKKDSESESEMSTQVVKASVSSPTQSAPDSPHKTPDTSNQQSNRKKKTPSSSKQQRFSHLRSHDKSLPSNDIVSEETLAPSTSFVFSEPMDIDLPIFEKSTSLESPLRSFIFSPPTTRQSIRRESLGRTAQTPHLSTPLLLPANPDEQQTTSTKPRGRPRKAIHHEIKTNLESTPPEYAEESSIILLTPLEPRGSVTRGMDEARRKSRKSKVLLKKKRVHRID